MFLNNPVSSCQFILVATSLSVLYLTSQSLGQFSYIISFFRQQGDWACDHEEDCGDILLPPYIVLFLCKQLKLKEH